MGSEYERDGRWVVSWKDAAGRWREKRTTCRTKAEARRMREDLERQAERQAMGLEPLLQNRGKASFGELMDWWWERHGRRLKSPTIRGFIEKHLRAPLGDVPMLQVTAERFDKLLSDKEGELAPKSLNHLRAITHRMFALASLPGVGLWSGPNPIAAVPRRKVPKRLPEYLRWHEAPEVLDELAAPWRQVVAVAVYTALRKGEIFGLERQDVDLASGELRVRRSWDSDTVKDNEAVILPIARGLRPHLEEALAASKRGTLLFARPDCSMYPKDVAADEILRRAMARAGIVVGYEHRCRRKGCGFREMRASPDTDGCPKCRMLLWAKPIPRHVRFHDLRHTTATLLLKDGVSLATVQKVLRHSDPELTTAIYGHLDIADTRAALDRLTFEETDADRPSAPDGAPVARLRGIRKDEGRDGIGIPSDVAAFDESGRQDLNERLFT